MKGPLGEAVSSILDRTQKVGKSPVDASPAHWFASGARRPHEQAWFWPQLALESVPQPGFASDLARFVASQQPALSRADELALILGIPIHYEPLEAESGGLEALLVPSSQTRFMIICDPWTLEASPERCSFRIAHEIAHTLFYDWTQSPPRRSRPSSNAEEWFCDAFADSLLAYIPGPREPHHQLLGRAL
jgi:hypothetical protein